MGRSEHHRYSWQFGIWQDIGGNGDRKVAEFTVGGYSCNGTYYILPLLLPSLVNLPP
jgi:hypothetical protein